MDEFDDDIDDEQLCSLPLQPSLLDNNGSSVEIPDEFPFPFQPYDIQLSFMKETFKTLEQGKIGIFESPTGTGKSLSLICGSLTWLKHYEEKQREKFEKMRNETYDNENSGELDWITDFAKKQEQNKVKEEQESKLKREDKLRKIKEKSKYSRKRKREEDEVTELMKTVSKELKESETCRNVDRDNKQDDDEIVLTEYTSDDECKDWDDHLDNEDYNEDDSIKIYFCSRTHSQLAQFVREVKKSPFGKDTSTVTLGSRQNLCINSAVLALKSPSLINDTCLEMQQSKNKQANAKEKGAKKPVKSSQGVCPYYKQETMMTFRDHVLIDVKDIEELVTLGKEMKACPYYGTRYSIPSAQLVVLPYNTLLHKATREATGIKLKNNVVIIDEAHNLLETINSIHSVEITGSQVVCAYSQLSQYKERYKTRLKAKNLMYIKQILYILSSFIKCLGGKLGLAPENQPKLKSETKVMTINNYLYGCQMDNINLFKVKKYCEKSQVSKKLHGFVEKYQPPIVVPEPEDKKEASGLSVFLKQLKTGADKKNNSEPDRSDDVHQGRDRDYTTFTSPLMHIEAFLEALTNPDKNGRIVVNKQSLFSQSSIKFLLLNPAVHFADIVKEARSVIVAGGTMQPISEFKNQLFFEAGVAPDRITEFSCGHVIPARQLLPIAMSTGPSGTVLDFTYQSRGTPEMMDEVGRTLSNICNVVPGGVVCFFPSYDYEGKIYEHLEKTGFINRLANRKRIFREPKKANQVQHILSEYSKSIERCPTHTVTRTGPGLSSARPTVDGVTGALLMCVVGGKMSEGINFSDDMGRCILMVGLPYPNIKSPELKEKMDYLNANMPRTSDGKLPGQEHYENLCMKAVNQSIGRAIRHKGDYASIVLMDQRYQRSNVLVKLPDWISQNIQKIDKFGAAIVSMRKFFNEQAKTFI